MEPSLVVVGVNHQTVGVSVRETLAPRAEEAGRLNAAVRAGAGLADAVVLSTCSRFEVYASLDETGARRLMDFFARRAGRALDSALYVRRGPAAVAHLFRVSAGLDSWVIGETEVLGQVKSAYQKACAEGSATRPLHLAFQRALYVGKKVRTETAIVGGISSIGGAAALLASRIFSDLADRRIIVFGAGEMAAATVRHLRSKNLGELWVANRSLDHAEALARELGGTAMGFDEGFRRLAEADIAVFSTGAASHLLDAARAGEVSRARSGRPLFVIDLGMPRNVAPEAARAEGCFVYDMDDMRRLVDDSLRRRTSDLARAEAMVAEETADCLARIEAQGEPAGARSRRASCPFKVKAPSVRTLAA